MNNIVHFEQECMCIYNHCPQTYNKHLIEKCVNKMAICSRASERKFTLLTPCHFAISAMPSIIHTFPHLLPADTF